SGAAGQPPGGVSASFLPEEYVRARTEARMNLFGLVLMGVVLVGVVGAFAVTNTAWRSIRARQAAVDGQYAEQTKKIEALKKLELQTAEMLDKAVITTQLLERVPRSILMAELVNRMPAHVSLSEVSLQSKRINDAPPPSAAPKSLSTAAPSKDTQAAPAAKPRPPRLEFTLTMVGFSADDAGVADYQAALAECGLLSRVDLVSSAESVVEKTAVRKFKLEAQIRADADARRITPLRVSRTVPGAPAPVVEATARPEVNP
ncbi:MAG: PilN domain-containing protein, partial [Phycisphaerales bacterium]|nr:PilN domain-containing protein [Phycisphaerales bacterium]